MVVAIDDSMRCVLTAYVPGLPKTKGSLEHIGNGNMKESVVGSVRWRVLMVERFLAATRYIDELNRPIIPAGVAVRVDPVFDLAVDPTSVGSGDIDKLLRNVFDALSAHSAKCPARCRKHAGIYADDVQVTKVGMEKRRGVAPGVTVTVYAIGA